VTASPLTDRSAPDPVHSTVGSFKRLGWASLFAFLWASIILTAFVWHFTARGWAWNAQLLEGAIPFAAGAWLGGFLTALTMQAYGQNRSELRRFCSFLLLLVGLTLAITVLAFVLHYRIYFSTWHADFPSVQWGFQTLFTGLAAVYLFLGTGLKVFVPLPLISAVVLALLYGRRAAPA